MSDFNLKTNYGNLEDNEYSVLPEGVYELVIKSVQEQATKSGATSLSYAFVVREDLDGVAELAKTNAKYHKRLIFANNWERKDNSGYDMDQVQRVMKAAQIPEGTDVTSIDQLNDLLRGKAVRARVIINKSEGYADRNDIPKWNFSKTQYPLAVDPFADSGETIDIDESDLPF